MAIITFVVLLYASQVRNIAVFQSLENAHFGADFYAVFRDDFTDLHENLQKRSSLVQEWRRRFEFFAFHLHSKNVQPDRCCFSVTEEGRVQHLKRA